MKSLNQNGLKFLRAERKQEKQTNNMDLKNIILKNIKSIFYVITWGVLIYVILFRPNEKDNELYKEKINSIQKSITEIDEYQKKLNSQILGFNSQIGLIKEKISEVENQKIIIKEIYHEKISSVNSYSNKQLDSFFAERYGYYTY